MAQYTPASLESLLQNLTIASADEPDHEQILEHCDKVLSAAGAHPRALHTKIVALLNLDRYDDAWRVFESNGHAVGNATLEKAYCLYKLGRLEEAQEIAKRAADVGDRNRRGLRHVEAQAVSTFSPVEPSSLMAVWAASNGFRGCCRRIDSKSSPTLREFIRNSRMGRHRLIMKSTT